MIEATVLTKEFWRTPSLHRQSWASSADQLANTLAAVDLVLDAELKKELDELTEEYRRRDASR